MGFADDFLTALRERQDERERVVARWTAFRRDHDPRIDDAPESLFREAAKGLGAAGVPTARLRLPSGIVHGWVLRGEIGRRRCIITTAGDAFLAGSESTTRHDDGWHVGAAVPFAEAIPRGAIAVAPSGTPWLRVQDRDETRWRDFEGWLRGRLLDLALEDHDGGSDDLAPVEVPDDRRGHDEAYRIAKWT